MQTILKFFILIWVLALPKFALFSQPSLIHAPVLLKGRVMDQDGKGISQVHVTDGANIISTNEKGYYEFYAASDALFVYITVPSGYAIPHDNGIAQFYKKIDAAKGKFTADFHLTKLDQSDQKHFLLLWADPQINTDSQAHQLITISAQDTRDHALELQKQGPVFGLAAGDIYWDNFAMIPPYRKAVQVSGIPFFQVLGNHDMDINVRSDEASDKTFHENFGPSWYSFNRGKAHYVVLDNVFYYANGYNYIGYITEKQLHWLEQDLKSVEKGAPVFVSMHISAYTHEKRRYKRPEDNPGNITFNRQALYNLLKPFNAHLLTGHTHYNETVEEGGVFEHITAALCGAWWTRSICDDGTPAGYGVYEVDGNLVRWYYKTVGKPKSYQMKVYNKGNYTNRPNDIAVNVWNWDNSWKIEWYEDGIYKGAMKQETAFDGDAVRLMAGSDKPGKYPWIEPRLTDHLFFATPSSQAKKAEIIVTDRFGVKYNESLILQKTQK